MEVTISRMKAALGRTVLCVVAWYSVPATAAEIDQRFDIRFLIDIHQDDPTAGTYLHSFTGVMDKVYFVASGQIGGPRLWTTGGDAATTYQVDPTLEPQEIASIGNILLMSATSPQTGGGLWAIDPLVNRTYFVKGAAPDGQFSRLDSLVALNDRLILMANDVPFGIDPWVSRGTELNTQRLVDMFPASLLVLPMRRIGDQVFFLIYAQTGQQDGITLWTTDGTTEGTRALRAFPGDKVFSPLFELNGCACVVVQYPAQMWCTDGTPNGTRSLVNFPDDVTVHRSDAQFVAGNDGVFFFAHSPLDGFGLWMSDGTSSGTRRVDEQIETFDLSHGAMIGMGGRVYVVASTTNFSGDKKIWEIDPGARSMSPVTQADIDATAPRLLTDFNGTLVFVTNGSINYEPGRIEEKVWMLSPGAIEPTRVATFYRNAGIISTMTVVGQSLYFDADDGQGNEPWVWHNRRPVAVADEFRVKRGSWVNLDVLANDSDIDGALDRNSIEIVEEPRYGRLEATDSGLRYKRLGRWQGSDRFSYRVGDTQGAESEVVDVTINPGGGGFMAGWMVCCLLLLTCCRVENKSSRAVH